MKTKAMVLVPYWVENVLKRNRLKFTDVLNYAKMRELMSVEDVSAFLHFQSTDQIAVLKGVDCSILLSSWEQTRSTNDPTELASVVIPLSQSEATANDARQRYLTPATDLEIPVYQLVDVERDVLVVVIREGFEESMQQPAQALDFLRAVLKEYYIYMEVHQVSSMQVFRNYLERLNA